MPGSCGAGGRGRDQPVGSGTSSSPDAHVHLPAEFKFRSWLSGHSQPYSSRVAAWLSAAQGQQTRSSEVVEGRCGWLLYGLACAHNRSRDLGVSHGRWGTANPSNTRHPGRGGPWHARGQGFKSPQLHSHPNRRSPRFLRFGEIPWLVPLT